MIEDSRLISLLQPDWTLSDLCELPDQRGSGKRFALGGLREFLQAGTMPDTKAVGAEGVDRELVIMCPIPREGANVGLDLILICQLTRGRRTLSLAVRPPTPTAGDVPGFLAILLSHLLAIVEGR